MLPCCLVGALDSFVCVCVCVSVLNRCMAVWFVSVYIFALPLSLSLSVFVSLRVFCVCMSVSVFVSVSVYRTVCVSLPLCLSAWVGGWAGGWVVGWLGGWVGVLTMFYLSRGYWSFGCPCRIMTPVWQRGCASMIGGFFRGTTFGWLLQTKGNPSVGVPEI